MSAFEQTVNVLIKFIRLFLNEHVEHESILLHNALSVLNHVACSIDGQEKLFIGRVGAIEVKLNLFLMNYLKESICFLF
jgi:hypothetical protein